MLGLQVKTGNVLQRQYRGLANSSETKLSADRRNA